MCKAYQEVVSFSSGSGQARDGLKDLAAAQLEAARARLDAMDIQLKIEKEMDDISEREEDFDNPMSLADLANSLAS